MQEVEEDEASEEALHEVADGLVFFPVFLVARVLRQPDAEGPARDRSEGRGEEVGGEFFVVLLVAFDLKTGVGS